MFHRSSHPARLFTAIGIAAVLTLSGCGSTPTVSDEGDLVIYAGRDEALISPLIKAFEKDTGVQVEVRYAETPEFASTILVEGDKSPADVFLSQDAGALGALSKEGLLKKLPDDITGAVFENYTSTDDTWVGVTGRARVIAYDGEKLDADEVPGNVEAFTADEWKGRVGFPPGNASFQSFITGFRAAKGDAAAKAWLEGMANNDLQKYEKNGLVLEALNEGSLDIGLINHYYWYEKAAEVGAENMRAQIKFADPGDPGALVNVTGAGILSDHPDAQTFVKYLISEAGQKYFVENTFEYPLIDGVEAPEGLPSLDDLKGPEIDLAGLADLETSVRLIDEAGLN